MPSPTVMTLAFGLEFADDALLSSQEAGAERADAACLAIAAAEFMMPVSMMTSRPLSRCADGGGAAGIDDVGDG